MGLVPSHRQQVLLHFGCGFLHDVLSDSHWGDSYNVLDWSGCLCAVSRWHHFVNGNDWSPSVLLHSFCLLERLFLFSSFQHESRRNVRSPLQQAHWRRQSHVLQHVLSFASTHLAGMNAHRNFSRVAAPLCLNFFQMITVQDTSFSRVMGDMSVAPIISDIPTFLPGFLVVLVLFNYFEIYSKILNFLGIKRFQYSDSFTGEDIDKGKEILTKCTDALESCEKLWRRINGE